MREYCTKKWGPSHSMLSRAASAHKKGVFLTACALRQVHTRMGPFSRHVLKGSICTQERGLSCGMCSTPSTHNNGVLLTASAQGQVHTKMGPFSQHVLMGSICTQERGLSHFSRHVPRGKYAQEWGLLTACAQEKHLHTRMGSFSRHVLRSNKGRQQEEMLHKRMGSACTHSTVFFSDSPDHLVAGGGAGCHPHAEIARRGRTLASKTDSNCLDDTLVCTQGVSVYARMTS
jgi:hypothetical protein